ncbi:MAG: sigma-70 family RNA polymerase sigma factor [Chloroherpetonaceae bacterium]|nr:sigma-70 family RNA polymerase sigma factor [Chloroherpetonaceae bacterium]
MKSDAELIALFKQGGAASEKAFTELVRRYQEKVYWICRRMLDSHEDADDVAQNVFLKVYDGLSDFKGDAEFYTWLYRIAMNETINFLRARQVRKAVSIDEILEKPASAEAEPTYIVEQNEEKELIAEAIAALPEKQKQVFMMRYYDELSYEEIADILGTSVGGLKANYFHAFRKIESYLKARLRATRTVTEDKR